MNNDYQAMLLFQLQLYHVERGGNIIMNGEYGE